MTIGGRSCAVAVCTAPAEPGGTFCPKHGPRVEAKHRTSKSSRKLRDVAPRGQDGELHCPRCGGTQFTARHSNTQRATVGIGSLLLPKRQVQCVACGAKFKR